MIKEQVFKYEVLENCNELSEDDLGLLNQAKEMTKNSYAPYSNFKVGAAARLNNGQIITGCNYENASIGATICAERVLLGVLQANYKEHTFHTLAISYDDGQGATYPITPCGICRQSLLEYEINIEKPIKIIMAGLSGEVWIIHGVHTILPLGYSKTDLLK